MRKLSLFLSILFTTSTIIFAGCNSNTYLTSNTPIISTSTILTQQATVTITQLPVFLTYKGTIQGIPTAGEIQEISIDYPLNWSVLPEGINFPLSFSLQNTDGFIQCSVSISATLIAQSWTLLAYVEQDVEDREYNPIPGTYFNIISPLTPTKIDGYPAYELTYTENRATADTGIDVWFLSPNDMLYEFSGLVFHTFDYNDYSGIIQHMLNSLTISQP
jgi:hypothetical protein